MLNSGFKSNGFEFHWEPSFAPASATDEFWATAFKRFGGTVIITGDKNIARRPHQIHAFCACDLICFFCDRHWSQQDLAYQCAHLIRWWPTVQALSKLLNRRIVGGCQWVCGVNSKKYRCQILRNPRENQKQSESFVQADRELGCGEARSRFEE